MEAFLGTWEFKDGEEVNALVERMGLKVPQKELDDICNCSPTVAREGDGYDVKVKFGANTYEVKFKLGEEFENTTMDGRKVKTLITLDGKVLKIRETGDKVIYNNWTVEGGILTMTLQLEDVSCARRFTKV